MIEYYVLVNKTKKDKIYLKENRRFSGGEYGLFKLDACGLDEATKYQSYQKALSTIVLMQVLNSKFRKLCNDNQIAIAKVKVDVQLMELKEFSKTI